MILIIAGVNCQTASNFDRLFVSNSSDILLDPSKSLPSFVG